MKNEIIIDDVIFNQKEKKSRFSKFSSKSIKEGQMNNLKGGIIVDDLIM